MLYFINALLLPSQGVINCYTYLRLARKGEVSEQHIKMDDHNCPRGLDIIVSDINEVNSSVGDKSDNNDERLSSAIQSRQNSNSDDSACFSVSMNFFEFLGS